MTHPTDIFQMSFAEPKLHQGGLYKSTLFGSSTSGGGVAPVGIVPSNRGGGIWALRIGEQADSGSPLSARTLTFDTPVQRLVLTFEVYLDYESGFRFLNWLRVFGSVTAGSSTVLEVGQENGTVSHLSASKHAGDSWSTGTWDSNHVQPQTPTKIKIDITASTTNNNAGPRDGAIRTYVMVDGEWVLVKSGTHNRGPLATIHFMNRPLLDIQADVPDVEFRNVAMRLDLPRDASGDAEALAFDFSHLQQCAAIPGVNNSAQAGKFDVAFFCSYDPRVYGTPSGAIQAEVQCSIDPTFETGVSYASVALVDADTYTGVALTDNVDFAGMAIMRGLDPLSEYHWRVRFVDGGTINAADEAIEGGTEVLLTDSDSFLTMSAPGGARSTIKIMEGTCQRGDDASTPHEHWNRAREFRPHLAAIVDDGKYADLTMNTLPACHTLTAGATRIDGYLLHERGMNFLMQPRSRFSVRCPVVRKIGNHDVDSQFPGNTSPTNATLVSDAMHACNRYFQDGSMLVDRPEGDWGPIDTAATRMFFINAVAYDNDGGSHGAEGRQLVGSSAHTFPRLLGETQMAALLESIETCGAPIFLMFGMPPFANDAEEPSSALVGWALAPLQRQAVIDAIEANDAIKMFFTFGGHIHFSCVTRQGLPKNGKHKADIIGAPMARPIGTNYDTAFLDDYDGGPIFKSNNEDAAVESMFTLIEVNEASESVRVRIQNKEGVDLYDESFDVPPINTTLQPLGGTINLNPHPRGSGRPRDKGFTVPGDPQPHPRGSGKPRPWSARE